MQDLRSTLQSARRLHQSGAGSVLDVLLRSTTLSAEELSGQLRERAGVVAILQASDARPDFTVMGQDVAAALGCVPVVLHGEIQTRLALADPWDDEHVRRATAKLGFVPQLAALPSALLELWLGRPLDQRATAQVRGAPDEQARGPVVEFVDAAIRAAYANGASDVHFECNRSGVVVKLRQDGVMGRFAAMDDPRRAEEVISRIKVLAQLDITERRTPQDGRFRFEIAKVEAKESIDLRVSIMPSVFGEDAVLRLLDKAQLRSRDESVSLDLLGFAPDNAERMRDLGGLPHGMLLVTGPTGSGKTTTVYALLSEINKGIEKIITIEDPVEYELPGVLQIPVNERKGLTFAKGLRSILRHDPDRILVGEIRDAETAEIAVQSALTGHQVFTTVHANSIFDVTGRFRHFGLDMFGFMSSLNGVVVQRLVRRLCTCADSRAASEKEQRWLSTLGLRASVVPNAVGCDLCRGSGYRGRSVIAEVHSVDDGLRDLVTGGMPVSTMREHVAASGVQSLALQAGNMVIRAETSTEEIKRVVGWL